MINVAIHSVPRSGSSWLGEIINSSPEVVYKFQPLFSYAFKDALGVFSTTEDVSFFFQQLKASSNEFLDQTADRESGKKPVFQKRSPQVIAYKEVRYHHILENMLAVDPSLKLVALVRNPLEVLASWHEAPREFRHDLGWSFKEEWRSGASKNAGRPEEFFGYDCWKEAAIIFHRLASIYPERVFLINYKDLTSDTYGYVKGLFRFVGLEFSSQTEKFIKHSTNQTVEGDYSIYKGRVNNKLWESVLSKDIIDFIFSDLEGSDLITYLPLI
tara:strand:+ start:1889 stop:2701 length:813 start_codon:yes stop_codon:yes gene_type:complete